MRFVPVLASLVALGSAAHVEYTTVVTTDYTTYCPYATTFAHKNVTYTATKDETLTITNCPCTVTYSEPPTSMSTYMPGSSSEVPMPPPGSTMSESMPTYMPPASSAPAESLAPPAESPAPPAGSSAPPAGSSAPPAGSSAPPAGSSAPPAGSSAPPAGSSAPPAGSSAPPAESAAPAASSSEPPASVPTAAAGRNAAGFGALALAGAAALVI